MTYLVDSDWVADWLQGRPQVVRELSALARDGLAISAITYGEIYEGVYSGRDPGQSEQVFRQWLHSVQVLPVTRPILRRFARVRSVLRSRGQLIGDFDTLIAATALQHNLTLLTGNVSHFNRVSGLKLHQPTTPRR